MTEPINKDKEEEKPTKETEGEEEGSVETEEATKGDDGDGDGDDGPLDEEAAARDAARREAEAKAVAEATASADAAYVPSPSLLTSPSPLPLLRQVDGPTLEGYSGKESVYQAKNVPVPLRSRLDVPIHISAGGSVVEYTVKTLGYDIAFGITAEREEGVTIVTESSRVNCHLKPVSGKFLVGSVPCAIVFSFDNEYSWFREKQVTYKVTVTPPSRENVIAGRRRRAKSALKAVTEDRTGADTRLSRASAQRSGLAAEIARMEKELAEKKKSFDVAEKEERWLRDRVALRKTQEEMLRKRLDNGWDDETDKAEQAPDGADEGKNES